MSQDRITIPIVPYGLRQEETIIQIAAALRNIDTIATNVFQQIEDNINTHRRYLSDLQRRSKIVAGKVDQLAGRNMATTVYSHHKFPAREDNYDTLFHLNLQNLTEMEKVTITDKYQNARYNKNSNILKFYHLKTNNESLPKYEEQVFDQGLGSIPKDVEDISSLLLFNTSENIYSNYVMRDPLSVDIDYSLSNIVENNPSTSIAAAPNSIINNHAFQNNEYFNSFYTPAYQEVPTIDVPVDLPDLPGIADNLKFSSYSETPIAPSKHKAEPKITEQAEVKPIDNDDIISIPEPIVTPKVLKVAEPLPTVQAIPPPPPPPPPPPTALPVAPPPPKNDAVETPKSVPAVDNVHANLMEAIRNAGGKDKARLRPISQLEIEPSIKSSETKESDFMADLYAKLALRRKGISGQVKDNTKNPSLIDRMSSLIPPSPPNESESDEDVSNDWDD